MTNDDILDEISLIDQCSVPYLQRKYKLSHDRAKQIMDVWMVGKEVVEVYPEKTGMQGRPKGGYLMMIRKTEIHK